MKRKESPVKVEVIMLNDLDCILVVAWKQCRIAIPLQYKALKFPTIKDTPRAEVSDIAVLSAKTLSRSFTIVTDEGM